MQLSIIGQATRPGGTEQLMFNWKYNSDATRLQLVISPVKNSLRCVGVSPLKGGNPNATHGMTCNATMQQAGKIYCVDAPAVV